MKKLLLFVVLTALYAPSFYAQPDKYALALMNTPFIVFEEIPVTFREKTANSISILVTADQDSYSKDWKSWLKSRYMLEGKKDMGFYSCSETLIGEWSPDSLKVHFKIDKDGDASRLWLVLEKKGEILNSQSHGDVLSQVKIAIGTQVKDFYIKYYDEKIADQQKYYDLQTHDLEKLNKKHEKLQGEIKSKKESIEKNKDRIRDTESQINEKEGLVKTLNAELQNNQKAAEQAQKEVDAQTKLIKDKEVEYNKLNAAGALNSKEGERVIKDLEKFRSKMEKLNERVLDTSEDVTKSENKIIDEEKNKTKLESKLEEYRRNNNKLEEEISDLNREVENNDSSIRDEQKQVESALADLDKLKAAKLGVTGVTTK